MASWVSWLVAAVIAVALGVVANRFGLRTVRRFTALVAVALTITVTVYGLTHPAPSMLAPARGTPDAMPPDLEAAFARGADGVAAALFHPLWLGHAVPEPGRAGWAVIIALLVLGYRQLEAQAYRQQAAVLDTSQLGEGQPGVPGNADGTGTLTAAQRHDQLVAELKFRLAAMEVRSPAILPGGSRSDGLASIAEDTGVTGADLAGAVIRFLGVLWPGPRRWQLRVWMEPSASMRVTVELDNPRSGTTVASKTVAATDLSETASMVAGYVARQVFASDPATPPWCYGASDGNDLGALLIARQQRVYAASWEAVRDARRAQIQALQAVTAANRCAGVVRYELAQLHDLGRNHLTALRLHAVNREQYPRFFRGRYRLGMSLEMAAQPGLTFGNPQAVRYMITEILAVLNRCRLTSRSTCTGDDITGAEGEPDQYRISDGLSLELLKVALAELRVIRRQLSLPAVLLAALCHRHERAVWRPHRKLRVRQAFRDGTCVAELLVALRMIHNDPALLSTLRPARFRHALRVTAAITGDSAPIEAVFGARPRAARRGRSAATPERVRVLPWLRATASWQAAYNTACIYSALAQRGVACEDRIVASLRRAIDSRDSEMERPYDWISYDPDFVPLKNAGAARYPAFTKFLRDQKRRDYPRRHRPPRATSNQVPPQATPGTEVPGTKDP